MLQPIIHCWLSISQEPVDRANKLRHRTQRKSRSPIQEVRSVFISRDYKQIATRDGVNGFAECISEQDETYKVTSAFNYAEELVNMIQIANEDEIPE